MKYVWAQRAQERSIYQRAAPRSYLYWEGDELREFLHDASVPVLERRHVVPRVVGGQVVSGDDVRLVEHVLVPVDVENAAVAGGMGQGEHVSHVGTASR